MKMFAPVIALILVVLIANSAFIVQEGQSDLVLQFGRIEGAGTEGADLKPGLHYNAGGSASRALRSPSSFRRSRSATSRRKKR